MKIPVIRGQIGDWRYYCGVMSFEQIEKRVQSSTKEFYNASCLSELLQRDLSKNYESIRDYLINEQERFFNALVLAMYDGDPQWLEVEFGDDVSETRNVGFLELSGNEIIFPVDGQHRVEGIKKALSIKESLKSEEVPVVFIAHKNTKEGKSRTRRLFSTLNRRAKPVGANEIIALDEDDVIAIITRMLVDALPIFEGKRITFSPNKLIPKQNKEAFTSLITLYQCNEIICKELLTTEGIKGKKYKEFLLYRPDESRINEFYAHVYNVWVAFCDNTEAVKEFVGIQTEDAAKKYRNEIGGDLLFRPVSITEYIATALTINYRKKIEINEVFSKLDILPRQIGINPWKGILWDGNKMISRVSKVLVRLMLLYLYDDTILNEEEYHKLKTLYKSVANYEGSDQELELLLKSFRDN